MLAGTSVRQDVIQPLSSAAAGSAPAAAAASGGTPSKRRSPTPASHPASTAALGPAVGAQCAPYLLPAASRALRQAQLATLVARQASLVVQQCFGHTHPALQCHLILLPGLLPQACRPSCWTSLHAHVLIAVPSIGLTNIPPKPSHLPCMQLVAQLEALATSYAAQIASLEPLISSQQHWQQQQRRQQPQQNAQLPLRQRGGRKGGIPRPSPSSRVQRLGQAAAAAVPVVCIQPAIGGIAVTGGLGSGYTDDHDAATCTQPNCRWCQYHARRQAQRQQAQQQAQQQQGRPPSSGDTLAQGRPVQQASSELAAEALVLRQKFPLEPQGKDSTHLSCALCFAMWPALRCAVQHMQGGCLLPCCSVLSWNPGR